MTTVEVSEKVFGYCNKIDIDYFDENNLGTLGSYLTLGKPFCLSGKDGDDAVQKLINSELKRLSMLDTKTRAAVSIYFFYDEDEWEDYEREKKEFAQLDEEDQEMYIVSEPECISFLVIDGAIPKGIKL